jgi:hypothetical protein
MKYNIDDINKIANFKTWKTKDKIDALLEVDCNMYCNLGLSSTKDEKDQVFRNSRKIYLKIKELDPNLGILLLQD